MKENFKKALQFVMEHECVFEKGHYGDFARVICENVSGDRGALTKFGIDQRSHPHVNIRALDYAQASQIYHDEEWTKCRCDDLPAGYDIAMFDVAVPSGVGEAALLLQRALNQAGAKPPVEVDGFIGAKTISAANARVGNEGLVELLSQREHLFYKIVDVHPGDAKFLRGWLDRNADLARLVAPNAKQTLGA